MGKKIGIFCSHYLPYLGGVERYTENLSQHLTRLGDEVVIVTSMEAGQPSREKIGETKIYRMPCIPLLEGRFPVSKPDREFRVLHHRIMQESFDLVIVQTRFYPHSLYGALVAKAMGARCVIIDHGTSHMTIENPFWDRLGMIYEHGMTGLLKLLTDDFFGVSKNCCLWLQHFHIKPQGVLYNAVDVKKIKNLCTYPIRNFREEFEIDKNTKVVTYAGRLVREKGIRELVEAFLSVSDRENIVLFVAGDGDEEAYVKSRKNDKIFPLGRLGFDEVIALLAQTDIFCLPTAYPEGFPTAVLEACACGCYVMTTDKGGSAELIPDHSYGMLLKNNRQMTLEKGLTWALSHEEERKCAAVRAQERAQKKFHWERTARQVHMLCL